MYNLRATVQGNPEIIAQFEEGKETFNQKIKDNVADYEAEGRSTKDEEMKKFIKSLEGEIDMCNINLISKYRN